MKQLVVALVLIAAMTGTAAAECQPPRTILSPPPGGDLPPRPTIYLFAGDHRGRSEVTVTQLGRTVPTDTRVVGETDAWTVIRVQILADTPGRIDVSYTRGSDEDGHAAYEISERPPADEEKLYAEELVDDEWPCSFTRGVQLELGGTAVALRLEYAADVGSLRDGHGESVYLPVREDSRHGGEPMLIGHLSCQGWDISPEILALGVYVRLVAVYADGREHAEELGLLRMNDRRTRPPDWYDGFLSLDASADPAPNPDRVDVGVAIIAGAGGGAFAAVAALLIASRVRRRRRARAGRL